MTLHLGDLRVRALGECLYDSPLSEMRSTKQTSPPLRRGRRPGAARGHRLDAGRTRSPVGPGPELRSRRSAPQDLLRPCRSRRWGSSPAGGVCAPGLNNVIRGLVQELAVHYGVKRILGFRNGLRGLTAEHRDDTVDLTMETVRNIHTVGGTILGSSRGGQDPDEMVDSLVLRGVGMLFVIGGDGGMRAATAISTAIRARGLTIAVIAVPKTIDNDLPFTDQSFGFQSAFARATEFISAVAIEAAATPNGVGIVKLMGRHSGFIASYAALAAGTADIVLVPEIPFTLGGKDGLLAHIEQHVRTKGHVVIVLAEGGRPRSSSRPWSTTAGLWRH